jgi:hypothetical protein
MGFIILFIAPIKQNLKNSNTVAMVGLSLKEISSSQPMAVQYNKLSKHKSAQQTVQIINISNNKPMNIPT